MEAWWPTIGVDPLCQQVPDICSINVVSFKANLSSVFFLDGSSPSQRKCWPKQKQNLNDCICEKINVWVDHISTCCIRTGGISWRACVRAEGSVKERVPVETAVLNLTMYLCECVFLWLIWASLVKMSLHQASDWKRCCRTSQKTLDGPVMELHGSLTPNSHDGVDNIY